MQLEKGKKYTMFSISSQLPSCYRYEFQVKDISYDGRPVIVQKGKRKRYILTERAGTEDCIFVEGWEILPKLTSEIVVDGCCSYTMNGMINFGNTTLEAVTALLNRNMNENFTRYDRVTFSDGKVTQTLTEADPKMMLRCQRAKRKAGTNVATD